MLSIVLVGRWIRLFSFKKMIISTAYISENKLSGAYLCKNGSMVIFDEYNTNRLQGRILILLNYDTVAWRNFLMTSL